MEIKNQNSKTGIFVNIELFRYLQGSQTRQCGKSRSFSRIEAFQSLLWHQNFPLYKSNNNYIPFEETIQHLSDFWGWNRSTVRSFLKVIEEMNIIKLVVTKKGISILFNGLSVL